MFMLLSNLSIVEEPKGFSKSDTGIDNDGQKFRPVSGTDALAAKRIEKLNDSEKKSC